MELETILWILLVIHLLAGAFLAGQNYESGKDILNTKYLIFFLIISFSIGGFMYIGQLYDYIKFKIKLIL